MEITPATEQYLQLQRLKRLLTSDGAKFKVRDEMFKPSPPRRLFLPNLSRFNHDILKRLRLQRAKFPTPSCKPTSLDITKNLNAGKIRLFYIRTRTFNYTLLATGVYDPHARHISADPCTALPLLHLYAPLMWSP